MLDLPPDFPPQYAPVVIAEASQLKNPAKTDRTIGVCHLIDATPELRLSAYNAMAPALAVRTYLKWQEGVTEDHLGVDAYNAAKVAVLQGPKHGELKAEGGEYYRYEPSSDYRGSDFATVLVEMGAYKVKVQYFFNVLGAVPGGTEGYDPHEDKKYCPQGEHVWKISLNPDDPHRATNSRLHGLRHTAIYYASHNKPLEPTR